MFASEQLQKIPEFDPQMGLQQSIADLNQRVNVRDGVYGLLESLGHQQQEQKMPVTRVEVPVDPEREKEFYKMISFQVYESIKFFEQKLDSVRIERVIAITKVETTIKNVFQAESGEQMQRTVGVRQYGS